MTFATSRPIEQIPGDRRVCKRCGIIREARATSYICRDCSSVLTRDEKKLWAA